MNNATLRLPFSNTDTGENFERGIHSSKMIANQQQTPLKRPFKDTTNKSSDIHLPQSAVKQKSEVENDKASLTFDFTFPPNQNCFCCGNDRKSDAELYFETDQKLRSIVDMMLTSSRIPEEYCFNDDSADEEEERAKLLPVIDFDLNDSPPPLSSADDLLTFWIKFGNVTDDYIESKHADIDEEQLNTSVMSIPEFVDVSSLDFDETW